MMSLSQNYYEKFKPVEDKLAKLLMGKNSDCVYLKPTEEEDMRDHWDIGFSLKIDVKAMKKINRSDSKPNENIHWVELKNVHGKDGWLYGEANYFAFELEDYFLIVPKIDLQKMVAEKCKAKEYATKKPEFYKFYTRNGRKDLIIMVKTIDLCSISMAMIEKGKIKEN